VGARKQFNVKWQFKVMYFWVSGKSMRDYISLYNDVGLFSIGSEDIANKSTENRRF